jgi:hypothetical protein
MSHIDGLDIVIRQKDGKVIAWMLQLSLYAKLRGIRCAYQRKQIG